MTPGALQTTSSAIPAVCVVSESLLPTGASRYGGSTPTCRGPLMIDVTRMPQTGALDFAIACAGAPAGAFGVLAIGARPDRAGSPLFGATFHLSTSTTIVSALVRADGLGAVEFPLPLAPGWRGAQAFAQFLFPNGTGCAPTALGASHGLELTIQ